MTAKIKVEATYGKFSATCEGTSQKEVFEALSLAADLFQFPKCGQCGGETRHQMRKTKSDDTYYSIICLDQKCRYEMKFGQHQAHPTLYAKAQDGWQPPYQAQQRQDQGAQSQHNENEASRGGDGSW